MRLNPLGIAAWIPLLVASMVGCSIVGADEGAGGADPTSDPAFTEGTNAGDGSGNALPASATDGKKNGDESDVDCGGSKAAKCADGKSCGAASDCESGVCTGGKCQAPTGTDGVKNGDESDVDCGGTKTGAPRCEAGKSCAAHADCASDGCGYDKKCAIARSCAAHFGGDTCGEGEVGDPGAKHESCCTAAPIPGTTTMLDKYKITAGRFRQFVERTNGNIRGFMETVKNDPDWKPAWNARLPQNIAEVNFLLGPTGNGTLRRGCDLGASRGRTYWMSDAENKALGETGTHPFSKDVLDQKMLNCVDWTMLQAFCIWDGGRLPKYTEFKAAWSGGENRTYPWGNTFDTSKLNWQYSYSFPEVYDKGNFVFVGAPGRFPEGNGKNGHADLAGLAMEWLYEINGAADQAQFTSTGSWEGHAVGANAPMSGFTPMDRGYWAIGGRCVR